MHNDLTKKHAYLDLTASISPPLEPLGRQSSDDYAMPWFMNEERVEKWRQNSHSDILIIEGAATMKSTQLSEDIFRNLMSTSSFADKFAFFSFHALDSRRNTMRSFLSSVVAQWLVHVDMIPDNDTTWMVEFARFTKQRAFTDLDLLSLLIKLRSFDVYGETVFVINNVDQCTKWSSLFWRQIQNIFETRDAPWKFVLLTASRQELADDWVAGWPCISISEEMEATLPLHSGIALELDSGLLQLLEANDEKEECNEKIQKATVESHDPRLARFTLRQLQHARAKGSNSGPSSIMETPMPVLMKRIMDAVPGNTRQLITKVLSCVVFSRRLLSVRELHSAIIASEEGVSQSYNLSQSPPPSTHTKLATQIENIIPGILDLGHEVDFLHPHLRNFFMQAEGVWYDIKKAAHYVILQACLNFISSPVGQRSLNRLQTVRHGPLSTPVFKFRDDLGAYAAEHWVDHYDSAAGYPGAGDLVKEFFQNKTAIREWDQACWFMSNPLTRADRCYMSVAPLSASIGLQGIVAFPDGAQSSSFALIEASRAGRLQIVQKLVKETDVDHEVAKAVLLAASSSGSEDLQTFLVDHFKSVLEGLVIPQNLIIRASWQGQVQLVKALVDFGVDLYVDDEAYQQQGPLHSAARHGHFEITEILIQREPSLIHAVSESGRPIGFATMMGHPKLVRLLLDNGADVNDRSESARPIAFACAEGRHAAARVLLEAGAETNFQDQEEGPWTPLVVAASENHIGCVRLLLDHGAQVDRSSSGGTALYRAVLRDYLVVCRMLLDHGADASYVGKSGSILACAAENRNFEIVKLLIEHGADFDGRANEEQMTALHKAVASQASIEMATYLLDKGADVNARTPQAAPIYSSSFTGNVDIVRLLIARGADVSFTAEGGWTPLHAAYNDATITRALLEAGADINKINEEGDASALDLASTWNKSEVVEVLIERKADVNLRLYPTGDSLAGGRTALSSAVANDHARIACLLLEAGADINIKHTGGTFILQDVKSEEMMRTLIEFRPVLNLADERGITALHSNIGSLSVVKMLIHGGCDIEVSNKRHHTPLGQAFMENALDTTRFLIKRGAKVNALVEDVRSPLNYACNFSTLKGVKMLVDNSADVNQTNSKYGSPVYAACVRPSQHSNFEVEDNHAREIIEYLLHKSDRKADINRAGGLFKFAINPACAYCSVSTIDVLLEAGANVNVSDSFGRRPIHFAVYVSVATFERICKANAELSARDKIGRKILHYAVQNGSIEVVKTVLAGRGHLLGTVDVHQWTPLHYAARGSHPLCRTEERGWSTDIISFLIGQDLNLQALSKGLSETWSPLKLARYYGAPQEIQDLLKPKEDISGENKEWDDAEHQTRKGANTRGGTGYCDCCFFVSILCLSRSTED